MSKKRKIVENSHHLLYMKNEWNTGYAKKLRERFIYKIPVPIHDELHHAVLQSVHNPSDVLLRQTWEILQESPQVASYGILRALAWLYVYTPDPEFRKDIQKQIDFFVLKGVKVC